MYSTCTVACACVIHMHSTSRCYVYLCNVQLHMHVTYHRECPLCGERKASPNQRDVGSDVHTTGTTSGTISAFIKEGNKRLVSTRNACFSPPLTLLNYLASIYFLNVIALCTH